MKAKCIIGLEIEGAKFEVGQVYDFDTTIIYDDTPIPGVKLARGTKHRHIKYSAKMICIISGRPVPSIVSLFDKQYAELHPQDELGFNRLPFEAFFQALEEVKDVPAPKSTLGSLHDRIIFPQFKPSFEDMEKWKHQMLNYPKPYKKLTIEVEMTYPSCDIYDTKDIMEFVGENIMAWLNANLSDGDDRLKMFRLKVTNDGNSIETK